MTTTANPHHPQPAAATRAPANACQGTRPAVVGPGLAFGAGAGEDTSLAFWSLVQTAALDATEILDVGCGRGAMTGAWGRGRSLHDLRAPGRTVTGIDVDPAALANPVVDRAALIEDDRWPVVSGSVDLVVADWVLEHVQRPTDFVAELDRVLRPGGAFLARTVSRRSPVALASRLVPQGRHAAALRRLQPGKAAEDTFPACYRMNNRRDLGALFDDRWEWSTWYRPAADAYVRPWPRLAAAVATTERVLPRSVQVVLMVCARKRG